MKAQLLLPGGGLAALPELLSWRVTRTDGWSADSFALRFATDTSLLPTLRREGELRLLEGGEVVFRGVVDEVEAVWAGHFVTTLCGRGLAAKLMDRQVAAAQFYSVDLATIVERYVRPCGIGQVVAEGRWSVQLLSVPAGASCYQVLCGFCQHAGAPMPRFLADGTLYLGSTGQMRHLQSRDLLAASARLCRYGALAEQTVIDLSRHQVRAATHPGAQALGVTAAAVTSRAGPFTRVTERTAAQRLRAAARGLDTLELTVAGDFAAEPCDTIRVDVPELGIADEFLLRERTHSAGSAGETCVLALHRKELDHVAI